MKRIVPGIVLLFFAMTVSAAGSPAGASTNLLTNPGFETAGGSYTGWFTFGSGPNISTPGTDNIFRSGTAAAKIFGEFSGCPGPGAFTVGGFGQLFTPTAGREYEFSGYTFISNVDPMTGTDICNSNRVLAKIVFFNAASGGSEISSNEIIIAKGGDAVDRWVPFDVSAPVPTGALRVEALILYLQPACDEGAVFVDDLSFCEVVPAPTANALTNASFSSGLADWSTFGNVFSESQSFGLHTAPGSAKLFSTFAPGFDSGMYQLAQATPGSAWKLDLYAMTTCLVGDEITGSNDNFVLARIQFRDSGGTELGSNEVVLLDATAPLGNWRRRSVVAVAPAGTDSVAAYIIFSSPTEMGGAMYVDDVVLKEIPTTGVPARPAPFALHQNVPNPVRAASGTRIAFDLFEESPVNVTVYDISGRRVARLFDGRLQPGSHAVTWDGTLDNGAPAAAGVYRYVLATAKGSVSKGLTLVR